MAHGPEIIEPHFLNERWGFLFGCSQGLRLIDERRKVLNGDRKNGGIIHHRTYFLSNILADWASNNHVWINFSGLDYLEWQ